MNERAHPAGDDMNETSITSWLSRANLNGPTSCAVCGCRLTEAPGLEGRGWRHFPSDKPGHDARGCRPRCVTEIHDRDGRVRGILSQVAVVVAAEEARHEGRHPDHREDALIDDEEDEEQDAAA